MERIPLGDDSVDVVLCPGGIRPPLFNGMTGAYHVCGFYSRTRRCAALAPVLAGSIQTVPRT
jgi:hypothetical protein